MTHRLGTTYNSREHPGLHAKARQQPALAGVAPRRDAGYTLAHAGHQLRLGPIAFWVAVGTLVIMAGWTISTATYFAFQEDVLTRLIARQAEMQFAYEDRIAELRAQVDRISSRQLLDQEKFEHKLDQMLRRQTQLESRASAIGALPDMAPTGSVRPAPRTETPRASQSRPAPLTGNAPAGGAGNRGARLDGRVRLTLGSVDTALTRLQASLDQVEANQTAALNSIEESFDARARRIRGVLVELGIDTDKLPPAARQSGTGGPFVPVRGAVVADNGAFERHMQRVGAARAHFDRLNRTLAGVPVRKPVMGAVDLSSGFGMRLDPFIRSPALHTGLDLRGDTGDPVRATANGTVTIAGWQGGYGKTVEIDHGNGFSTRYGHLSEIDVKIGQTVKIGQIVGRVGSTGRSTGPHLHYETRVDGEAVDPQKFLRAGIKLGTMQ